MARGTTTSPIEREHRTMILPVSQEHYGTILPTSAKFRQWVDENYERHAASCTRAEYKSKYRHYNQCHKVA